MSNIKKIIAREYWTRVKKKSFIIMTILAPILIVALYAGVFGMMYYEGTKEGDITKTIVVNQAAFMNNLPDTLGSIVVSDRTDNLDTALNALKNENADAVLFIKSNGLFEKVNVDFYTRDGSDAKQEREIESSIEKLLVAKKKAALNLNEAQLDSLDVNLAVTAKIMDKNGIKESNASVRAIIGLMAAFMIYIFIFMFSVQVMRGVTEEKTNRIVEVVISTVKPFELMFGKIVGIALVGLTQFMMWILLTGILMFIGNMIMAATLIDLSTLTSANTLPTGADAAIGNEGLSTIQHYITIFGDMPWAKIGFTFLAFFIGGYLLYSSIFAAIGSSVDAETDTQQFMMPVSLPLFLGIMVAQSIAFANPDSSLGLWFSMIPFTSPIVMVVRACFDAPWGEILLSITLLFGTFILFVRIAGKIYRIGILTYGKKPSWKQLFKWIVSKQ